MEEEDDEPELNEGEEATPGESRRKSSLNDKERTPPTESRNKDRTALSRSKESPSPLRPKESVPPTQPQKGTLMDVKEIKEVNKVSSIVEEDYQDSPPASPMILRAQSPRQPQAPTKLRSSREESTLPPHIKGLCFFLSADPTQEPSVAPAPVQSAPAVSASTTLPVNDGKSEKKRLEELEALFDPKDGTVAWQEFYEALLERNQLLRDLESKSNQAKHDLPWILKLLMGGHVNEKLHFSKYRIVSSFFGSLVSPEGIKSVFHLLSSIKNTSNPPMALSIPGAGFLQGKGFRKKRLCAGQKDRVRH